MKCLNVECPPKITGHKEIKSYAIKSVSSGECSTTSEVYSFIVDKESI